MDGGGLRRPRALLDCFGAPALTLPPRGAGFELALFAKLRAGAFDPGQPVLKRRLTDMSNETINNIK